jgi:hypothetical protein
MERFRAGTSGTAGIQLFLPLPPMERILRFPV